MAWHIYTWGDKVKVLASPKIKKLVEGYQRRDFPAMT